LLVKEKANRINFSNGMGGTRLVYRLDVNIEKDDPQATWLGDHPSA
jgi:hypothetical protein